MAIVRKQDSLEALLIDSKVQKFLKSHKIECQTWPVPLSVAALQGKATLTPAEQARVMEAYRSHLERERRERGYIQANMVILSPSTPNLDTMLAKFDKPHYHDDDEVRYIFAGEGIFGFEPEKGRPFTVTIMAGDYIIVPAKTCHWFTLTSLRSIKAIRLFKDAGAECFIIKSL